MNTYCRNFNNRVKKICDIIYDLKIPILIGAYISSIFQNICCEFRRLEEEMSADSSGLRNLGNTCFMNSVVQCLFHTEPLRDHFNEHLNRNYPNCHTRNMKRALTRAFAELLESMEKGDAVHPHDLQIQIQKLAPEFTDDGQQDAQEFLRYLLNGLHEDVCEVIVEDRTLWPRTEDDVSVATKSFLAWRRYTFDNHSRIVDLFAGQLKSTLTCTTCGHQSATFDPFWDLSLPIPRKKGRITLSSCLTYFTKELPLTGDERPTCVNCRKRRECYKRLTLHRLPEILVLHLKRFANDEYQSSKIHNRVLFPTEQLDVSKYSSTSICPSYDLYAVSNHLGTIQSGHYTAYCKEKRSSTWYEFDDEFVTSISTRDVVSRNAYILFYEMKMDTLLPGQL